MISAIVGTLLPGLMKIGDKLIEDKDKKMEFAFKSLELAQKSMEVMMNTKTYPWVDALVKLMYALEHMVTKWYRPVGSLAMAFLAYYAEKEGVNIPEVAQNLLYSAPIAWGVSRHAEKKRNHMSSYDQQNEN